MRLVMVRIHSFRFYARRLGRLAGPFLFGLASLALCAQQESAPRKALVIGNEHYTLLHQIPAAGNGAREISEALQRLHFEVTQAYDLNLAGFRKFIEKQFIPNLKPGDVCVVYYSGYGLQHKDHNYFVPVDFDPQAKGEVYEVAYDFENLNGDLVGQSATRAVERQ